MEVKGLTQSSKEELENARAMVTICELPQFKEVHNVVLPNINKEKYEHTMSLRGEEVMTLPSEEQRTITLWEELMKCQRG